MTHWIDNAVFYHIYPLGLCGAPRHNDGSSAPVSRLDNLIPWLEGAAGLGCNALYLGPLFESVSHGYDTSDYYKVDRRLGDHAALQSLIEEAHRLGLRVILDGVFNHVGRDFFAFRDILANRQNSAYTHWFSGLDFAADNSYHDRLSYHCWDGHENLVKLNLSNAQVRAHLFDAVRHWMEEFDIDGLRLDAADVIDKDFLSELAGFAKKSNPDFWLMGEVVHGDYRDWANPDRLDSVTNYECFKGLYSSFNDRNLFEIAWSLNRQFGEGGLYRHLNLYNFADNHDVSRVASLLKDPANLLPLYTILFSIPGVPSLYYGSEFALKGAKEEGDEALRPALKLEDMHDTSLIDSLKRLAKAKREVPVLGSGSYRQLFLASEQLAFARESQGQAALTLINAADQPATIEFSAEAWAGSTFYDVLNTDFQYTCRDAKVSLQLPPHASMLLVN